MANSSPERRAISTPARASISESRRTKRGAAVLLAAALAAAAPPSFGLPESQPDRVDRTLRAVASVLTDMDGPVGRVYFPVVIANPNSGITTGILPVWLVTDDRHEIRHIVAPMLSYNRVFGPAFSGTYYYYPTARSTFRAVLEQAAKSNHRASVRYESVGFMDGRCVLKLEGNYEADGTPRFYGVGPGSSKGAEASYRLLERTAKAEVGVKYWGQWQAAVGWRFRRTEVQPGVIPVARAIPAELQAVSTYSLPRVAFTRDTRDYPTTPGEGSFTEFFAEISDASLGGSADYRRVGGQWRLYVPETEAWTAAFHAQMESSFGGVPFTALANLGGPRSLRAFPEGRFQDRGAAFVNFEERWALHRLEVVNAVTEFQVAPFIEAGTVHRDASRTEAKRLQTVAGVGLRAVVKPTVVGKIDVGVGREGPAVFVGIDYPF